MSRNLLLDDLLSTLRDIANYPDEFGEIEDAEIMVAEMCEKAEEGIAIAERAINREEQSNDAVLRALENLVDCPGITWLTGYKDELDAAMLQARKALAQARPAPKSQGFVVALYRSADDEVQTAMFPAEHLDAAEDWLVQMAQYDDYDVSDFNELRALETREPFSVDIFDGKPGGRMQLR